jgi:hypothetical protein
VILGSTILDGVRDFTTSKDYSKKQKVLSGSKSFGFRSDQQVKVDRLGGAGCMAGSAGVMVAPAITVKMLASSRAL